MLGAQNKSKAHLGSSSCSPARRGRAAAGSRAGAKGCSAARAEIPSLLRFKAVSPLLQRAHATTGIRQKYNRAWPAQHPALRVGLQGASEGVPQAGGDREGAEGSSVFLFPKVRVCPDAGPCLQGFPCKERQLLSYRFSAVHLSPFGQAGLGLGSPLHLLHDSLDVASGDPVEKHGWGTERTSIFFCSAPHYFHIQTPESLDHPKCLHRGAQRREGGCNRSFSLRKH